MYLALPSIVVRKFCGGLILAAIVLCASRAAAADLAIDASARGDSFSRGVRGQAVPSISLSRPPATIGTHTSLEVARGSSIRGVAGGLEGDFYDWRTRNNDVRATTLDYLRFARDYNARLVITANIRGLAEPDPSPEHPDGRRFYDTSIPTLTRLAADWVRYTNVIAQTYRQGDTISSPEDQAILDTLVWSTGASDTHDVLPTAAEDPLPKVEYWEIGNEPRVPLQRAYKFTNSFTFFTPNHTRDDTHKYDYRERYAAITLAMRTVDPTIKVGPAMQWLDAVTERELLKSILEKQPNGEYLPVDFIGYHPYQKIYQTPDVAGIESRLRDVYATHRSRVENLRAMIARAGRDPRSVELMASEANVSNHSSNGTPSEGQMAHALGTVEEVFSFARLGLSDAHYWLWPADGFTGTEFPVYKAYEGLRDHLGDTLLSDFAKGDLRLYATRDSASGEIAIWGLNFSNAEDASLELKFDNLPDGYAAKLHTLGATGGATTLFSSNLPAHIAGGPTNEVDWQTKSLPNVNLASYDFALPAATLSVLVITPTPPAGDSGGE